MTMAGTAVKVIGAVLSLAGVLVVALGAVVTCGMLAGGRPTLRGLLPFLLIGGGVVLLWIGNRLQGWGMLGRQKQKGS